MYSDTMKALRCGQCNVVSCKTKLKSAESALRSAARSGTVRDLTNLRQTKQMAQEDLKLAQENVTSLLAARASEDYVEDEAALAERQFSEGKKLATMLSKMEEKNAGWSGNTLGTKLQEDPDSEEDSLTTSEDDYLVDVTWIEEEESEGGYSMGEDDMDEAEDEGEEETVEEYGMYMPEDMEIKSDEDDEMLEA